MSGTTALSCPTGPETTPELWVPARELGEAHRHIVGRVEVVRGFRPEGRRRGGTDLT
ncbi:hypothetical protein [Streptomyces oceani]|uniref:hypothetical protein n=1 Tax=Streptomyces oceani TaxID=1075402 RepID=UPI001BAFDB14|nr:hypothetical protein [Streptomyces oceani]